MKDWTKDERIMVVGVTGPLLYMFWAWRFQLTPIFWAVTLVWVVIITVTLTMKYSILKDVALREDWRSGIPKTKTGSRLYVFILTMLLSALVPMVVASIVNGLRSIFLSGLIGSSIGIDIDIVRSWLGGKR